MVFSVTHYQGHPLLQQLQASLCPWAKQTPFPSVLGNPHRSWEPCRSNITLTSLCANKSCPVHSKPQMFHIDPPVVLAGWNGHDCCPLSFLSWTELENKGEGKVCGCVWLCSACLLGACRISARREAGLLTLSPSLSLSPSLWLIMQSVSQSNVLLQSSVGYTHGEELSCPPVRFRDSGCSGC